MAFAAVQNTVPLAAWIMLVANIAWSLAYDTEYAMVDREDDLKIGIHSSAITFGRFEVIAIMFFYSLMLTLLVIVGRLEHLGICYDIGLLAALCIAIYHFYLIKNREPNLCFKAFSHNNWLGAVIFVGILGQSLIA